jgi:hypothetical protein
MTTRFSACFSTFQVVAAMAGLSVVTGAEAAPTVLVMLQNDAAVSPDLVNRAQADVVRLFALIDVVITWVTEVPRDGARLRVVSLTTWEPAESKIPASVLGYTQAGIDKRGVRAYVFWHRVERSSQKFTASLDRVLAIAIAHELGHMLLPTNAHARRGLMQAPWDSEHFRSASAGLLHFSPETANAIRRGLTSADAVLATRFP